MNRKEGRTMVAARRPAAASATPIDLSSIPAYPPVAAGPQQTVAGECFVVTDGGKKIKLAQVEVRIYAQREFEWYAQEVITRSKARFEGVKSLACPANFAALSTVEMDRSLAAADGLQHDLHVVWQALPAADASARTDADGRFSVTHRVSPPFVIFAVGSRSFGGETEYYRWQIPSSGIADPRRVELSNGDLR